MSTTAELEPAAATEDPSGGCRARRWPVAVAVVAAIAAFVAVSMLPWEWSFIDDTALITMVDANIAAHGRVGSIWWSADWLVNHDRDWGLFRPAFYLYVPLFYQLPVGVAHAVRIAMLAVAFAGPAVLAARGAHGRRRVVLTIWAVLAVAADRAIYAGVWYPSLQELSGLCFIGLGMLAYRRPWLVVACWSGAAWFKSPFAWLLLAFGLVLLWRRPALPGVAGLFPGSPGPARSGILGQDGRTRAAGATATLLGAGTLAVAAWRARTGSYTASATRVDAAAILDRLVASVDYLDAAALVVIAGAVLLARRPLRPDRPMADPFGYALLAGGAGYLATLLTWQTGGYYAGPYVYLLTVGALLLFRPRETGPGAAAAGAAPAGAAPAGAGSAGAGSAGAGSAGGRGSGEAWVGARLGVALAALTIVAGYSATLAVTSGRRTHATVTGLRDCVLSRPDGAIIGFNREEGWARLGEIVRRHAPERTGMVVFVPNGQTEGSFWGNPVPPVDYYAHDPVYGPGTPSLMTGPVVCSTPYATVYAVPRP